MTKRKHNPGMGHNTFGKYIHKEPLQKQSSEQLDDCPSSSLPAGIDRETEVCGPTQPDKVPIAACLRTEESLLEGKASQVSGRCHKGRPQVRATCDGYNNDRYKEETYNPIPFFNQLD